MDKPPKIGSIPTNTGSIDANREWREFEIEVNDAFSRLRGAARSLRHPENIDRKDQFSQAVGEAWKEAKS